MGIETSDAQTSTKVGRTIQNDLENAMERMQSLMTVIDRMINSKPFPEQIAGFIEKYSYGSGKQGEMPRHRMVIKCGAGVAFAVDIASSYMDTFLANVGIGDLLNGTRLNGMFVQVDLNTAAGPVPISKKRMVTSSGEPENKGNARTDRFGRYLFIGCQVTDSKKAGEVTSGSDYPDRVYVLFEGDDEEGLQYTTDLTLL